MRSPASGQHVQSGARIYLCATPFHLIAASAVRDYVRSCAPRDSHVLIYSGGPSLPSWVDDGWTLRLTPSLPLAAPQRHTRQLQKTLIARSLVAQLDSYLASAAGDIHIHYAHLEDYLANHYYFNPAVAERATYHAVPDGALNFYRAVTRPGRLPTHFAKSFYAARVGLRYRPFLGMLTGVDRARTVTQYAMSALVVAPEKAVVVEPDYWLRHVGANDGCSGHGVMIIGQEADMYLIGREKLTAMWRRLASEIATRYSGPLFYKPHHDWQYGSPVLDAITPLLPGLTVVDRDERPIEMLVPQYEIGVVVSTLSSALLHCKLIYGANIRAVAFGAREVATHYRWPGVRFQIADLLSAFEMTGVELIDT